jgi:hypothetical protein
MLSMCLECTFQDLQSPVMPFNPEVDPSTIKKFSYFLKDATLQTNKIDSAAFSPQVNYTD